MSDIPEFDKNLISELQKLLDQVYQVRRGLFHPRRPGCACEGTELCSHHAGVYKRLEEAADNLALSIREAGRIE